jgi:septum formation protein
MPPDSLASKNACLKARAAAQLHPEALVIGADTVVSLEGEIFGKPCDLETAHRMLTTLGGRWHEVFTAVCILPPTAPQCSKFQPVEFVERTRVLLRKFSFAEREQYFSAIHPFDKAGAYAAQETSAGLVEAMEGSFSNVVGLPIELVAGELKAYFPEIAF